MQESWGLWKFYTVKPNNKFLLTKSSFQIWGVIEHDATRLSETICILVLLAPVLVASHDAILAFVKLACPTMRSSSLALKCLCCLIVPAIAFPAAIGYLTEIFRWFKYFDIDIEVLLSWIQFLLNRDSAIISEIRVAATDAWANVRFVLTNRVPRAHFRRRTDSPQTP